MGWERVKNEKKHWALLDSRITTFSDWRFSGSYHGFWWKKLFTSFVKYYSTWSSADHFDISVFNLQSIEVVVIVTNCPSSNNCILIEDRLWGVSFARVGVGGESCELAGV
ncbi:hypothetical protein [Lacticaseibacillus zeae]|uniref:hypothetical protein n=1 Tax=Lacticaseibacillus zeae TaxID=57037 RepID=UPI00155972ED|nr:hypothetical protein [Lacticaseibacillus zeae]MDE3316240.1 hypothetical protein [Lacticaseibacillus zeae]